MTSRSASSRIGADVIEAGRRDRAWRSGLTRPLPHWFKGAHLAGLSDHERRARFDELSLRATLHRGWVLAALVGMAAIVAVALWSPKFSLATVALWPAVILQIARHYALRAEFKRDAQAFDKEKGAAPESAAPIENSLGDSASQI